MYIGVAVGSGWQSYVAYINLGCYYIIGLPLGILMQWFTDLGVKVYILLYIMHFFFPSLSYNLHLRMCKTYN